MEVIGKTRVITTRGTPGEEIVEKIIREGDTLYSNGYGRINFELDKQVNLLCKVFKAFNVSAP